MAPHDKQRIGNYRLIQRIGRGSFGDVYLGQHIHMETPAAIKILHSDIDDEGQAQFLQEARTMGRLHHPHIIRVLDFGTQEEQTYLIMDYAEQGSLRAIHARGKRVSLAKIMTYARQIGEALTYLHDRKTHSP